MSRGRTARRDRTRNDLTPPPGGPRRTCIGCRRVAPAAELVRVVLAPDGRLVLGVPGRGGRGAWLCPDRPGCFDLAARGRFDRAFRQPVGRRAIEALRTSVAGRGRIEGEGPSEGSGAHPISGSAVRSKPNVGRM